MIGKNMFSKMILFTTLFHIGAYVAADECSQEFFIPDSTLIHHRKRYSSSSLPGNAMKKELLKHGICHEIYQPVDFSQSELMLHASSSRTGVQVYRVCPLDGAYPKYGYILRQASPGFRIKCPDMMNLDYTLNYNQFETYGTSLQQLRNFRTEQRVKEWSEYTKTHPRRARIYQRLQHYLQVIGEYLLFLAYILVSPLFLTLLLVGVFFGVH